MADQYRFTRHFRPNTRKQLDNRLAREEPGYTPPPPKPQRERLLETLGLLAVFLVVAGAVVALAVLD